MRLSAINEGYCHACGGWDKTQGGLGHKRGCPSGVHGAQITPTVTTAERICQQLEALPRSVELKSNADDAAAKNGCQLADEGYYNGRSDVWYDIRVWKCSDNSYWYWLDHSGHESVGGADNWNQIDAEWVYEHNG